ncbi:hypothetical protein EVAR_52685_1 [Eumeta japonica]|uniref:Uncharacterized protein n=1 Tax=Eumeta variegata TaxID=151549 RepID=A0A4C1Y1Z9_EUMVA|nr:hypothetical protein EVAR_52685_1 [Eumeta japonica]
MIIITLKILSSVGHPTDVGNAASRSETRLLRVVGTTPRADVWYRLLFVLRKWSCEPSSPASGEASVRGSVPQKEKKRNPYRITLLSVRLSVKTLFRRNAFRYQAEIHLKYSALSRGKGESESPESRRSLPLMYTSNSRTITSALPASRLGLGCVINVEWDDVEGMV